MKILYWTIKIISVALLIIPLILVIPGFILHVISEEIEERIWKKFIYFFGGYGTIRKLFGWKLNQSLKYGNRS